MQQISLQDSVVQHIDQAIEMFFEDKNEIAMHTLLHAALESLDIAGTPKEIYSFIKHPDKVNTKIYNVKAIEEHFNKVVKTSRPTKKQRTAERMWGSIVQNVYNFSKHGGYKGDLKSKIDFEEGINEFILIDAIELYRQLTHDMTISMLLFVTWFIHNNDDLKVYQENVHDTLKSMANKLGLSNGNKLLYLAKLRQLQNLGIKSMSELNNKIN